MNRNSAVGRATSSEPDILEDTLTRDVPMNPDRAALLFIDVQNYAAHRDGGEFAAVKEEEFDERYGWYFRQLEKR